MNVEHPELSASIVDLDRAINDDRVSETVNAARANDQQYVALRCGMTEAYVPCLGRHWLDGSGHENLPVGVSCGSGGSFIVEEQVKNSRARLVVSRPGDLSSIGFEPIERSASQLMDRQVAVEVECSSINFKDCL